MNDWGRLITAMATPMKEDHKIDFDATARLARQLVKEGTTAILVAGTTGEGPTVTADEKMELFRLVKKETNVPVIAGVGTNNTTTTIENCLAAEACGVDGLLVVVPFYNKPNQASLYAHFQAVEQTVHSPIMLYNVPGRTGTNMSAETTIRLSKLPKITAVKEASGNLSQMTEILCGVDPEFRVYTGEDAQTLASLSSGAYGVVSVASQIAGPQMDEMIKSYLKGDVEKAAALHQKLYPLFNDLFMTANPIPVKAALNLRGFGSSQLRLPLTAASSEVIATMKKDMKNLGVL